MGLTDSNGLSAADIAAVTGNNGNGFGFNGDGAWWLLILFLFAFMGNNGWGNGFGGGYAPGPMSVDNSVQRGFDQSAIMNGLSGIQSAVVNGFSDAAVAQCNQTASMLQGFNQLGGQISNAGYNIQNQLMTNEMARQQCCCDTKQAIADVKYTIATENCADRAAIGDGLRDIIANQNANTQAILDKMCQQEIDALKTQNANLQTQVTMQNLAASQAAQTAQIIQDNNAQTASLINRIAPYPIPSYPVSNPYAATGCVYNQNPCGCQCGATV